MTDYPRVAKLNTFDRFTQHLTGLGIDLPCDEYVDSAGALARPLISPSVGRIGNRFCILPMEGWDGTNAGFPTKLTERRWKRFGLSGAKLIWGGEAVAVRPDGRANPRQLLLSEKTVASISSLRNMLVTSHRDQFGQVDDLSVGLQLTHSGRFARPNSNHQLEPRTIYRHPVLDPRFSVPANALLTDDELKQLIDDFLAAAVLAEKAGFAWVDIKHCHGYLGHELLSGFDRIGEFGGSFDNRTRFLREIVAGVRATTGLAIGVRLSMFDFAPFDAGPNGVGQPAVDGDYHHGFGCRADGISIDFQEPIRFVELLSNLGIDLMCTTAGSPYYNPHIQRPATFPPSDGYLPPEDPLLGVARQIQATATLKAACPEMTLVGSGYSYLQDWLPHVGQAVCQRGMVDSIGLGRMVLSYPELPADVLAGKTLARKRICRTFSDCTTAPRNGLVSGCYPLDPFYKQLPEFIELKALKTNRRP